MILAPIFLGEPRLCTQKIQVDRVAWLAWALPLRVLVSSLLITWSSVACGAIGINPLLVVALGAFWNGPNRCHFIAANPAKPFSGS